MITRQKAIILLRNHSLPIGQLDEIFEAFGVASVAGDTGCICFFHARYTDCGMIPVRDDGVSFVTGQQRRLVRQLLDCVVFKETFDTGLKV